MSFHGRSVINIEDVSNAEVDSLFQLSSSFKRQFQKNKCFSESNLPLKSPLIVALLFFEPSTRTLLSFQMASQRLGLSCVLLPSKSDSSLIKGESVVDTLENIGAMEPDLLVIRSVESLEANKAIDGLNCPILNGGGGATGHPTQALLDAFTIMEKRGKVEGEKVLIVGDVRHSRVANSNLQLLKKLGAEVAICGPDNFMPNTEAWSSVKKFTDLNEGASWCTVIMGLRMQVERHKNIKLDNQDYAQNYILSHKTLKNLSSEAIIMSPGPFIRDLDLSAEILRDSRCVIKDQVTNGIYTRAALISLVLGINNE